MAGHWLENQVTTRPDGKKDTYYINALGKRFKSLKSARTAIA